MRGAPGTLLDLDLALALALGLRPCGGLVFWVREGSGVTAPLGAVGGCGAGGGGLAEGRAVRDGRRRVEWGCGVCAGRGGAVLLLTHGEHARAPDAQAQAVHEACDITRE